VAGEFGLAQEPGEGRGAVLGGERDPLFGGEVAGGGELVEPAGGAAGGGQFGGVGQQLGGGTDRAGVRGGFDRGCQGGAVRFGGLHRLGQHGPWRAVDGVVHGAGGGVGGYGL
jgi:hypothetical protein